MKINIITVGKIKEDYWNMAINEYAKRLSKYVNLNFIEVKDEPIKDGVDCKKIEGERILAHLPSGYNIVLAILGKELDSIELSKKINDCFT